MSPQHDDELSRFGEIPDLAGASAGALPPRPPLASSEAPDRAAVRNRRALALALGLSWFTVHLAVYGVRGDFSALPLGYLLLQVLTPLALAASSLLVAQRPGKFGLGVRVGLVALLALLGPALFCFLAVGLPEPHAASPDPHFWLSAFVCFNITLAWVSLPLLCAALGLRRGFAAGARWRGALVGAACGLFSGGMINLHCPNIDRFHMALGHGLAVLIAGAVGAVLLARTSRI